MFSALARVVSAVAVANFSCNPAMVAALLEPAELAAVTRVLSSAWAARRSAASFSAVTAAALRVASWVLRLAASRVALVELSCKVRSAASCATFWSLTLLSVSSTWRPILRAVSSSVSAVCSSRVFFSKAAVSAAGLGALAKAVSACLVRTSSAWAASALRASSALWISETRLAARASLAACALSAARLSRRSRSTRSLASSPERSVTLAKSASRSLRSAVVPGSSIALLRGAAGPGAALLSGAARGPGGGTAGAGTERAVGAAGAFRPVVARKLASRSLAASRVSRSNVAIRLSSARPRAPFSRANESQTKAAVGSTAVPWPSR